jgi:hypothetical protein
MTIALAKKLANSGVFGDAGPYNIYSCRFLDAAIANRDEWENNGHKIIKDYLERCQELYSHQRVDAAVTESAAVENTSLRSHDTKDGSRVSTERQPSMDFADTGTVETAPSVAGASASSIHSYGTDDEDASDDPDVVYAVLDNPSDPYNFDSYSLLTAKMKRKREEKRAARSSMLTRTSMITRASNDERLKRFLQRQYSNAGSNTGGDSVSGGSRELSAGGGSSQSNGSYES